MDRLLHERELEQCLYVREATGFLEILHYSDGSTECKKGELADDTFEDFVLQRGSFSLSATNEGGSLVGGLRLVLQENASNADTFSSKRVSLSHQHYRVMMAAFKLPYRGIESSAFVGPCFVASSDHDKSDPHLQIIFRKSDVAKKGKTRGWELMLSHQFNTRMTTGFVKGTPTSEIVEAIKILSDSSCQHESIHPMLLPTIILSLELSVNLDQKRRDTRHWLRTIENSISLRNIDSANPNAPQNFDVDTISRDLVECHAQTLWKPPRVYLEVIEYMKLAMSRFEAELPLERCSQLETAHHGMLSRLEFLAAKLKSMDVYVQITLDRLALQREAMQHTIAEIDSRLNSEMARLAHASKRDSKAMKTLSLLSALFLPGTFVASLLSMTFFDFHVCESNDTIAGTSEVSDKLWIYFAVSIPLTVVIVVIWLFFNNRKREHFSGPLHDDSQIAKLERDILTGMRQRTLEKASHWTSPV